MNTAYVIILLGSPSDLPHCDQISSALDELGIPSVRRVASAHKTPSRLLEILREYESNPRPHVYITVAGRSNALSGMVDGAVIAPVIACPPVSSAFAGADVYSSLRMPSGIAPMLVLEPVNAALAAAKILSLAEPPLAEHIAQFQRRNAARLEEADNQVNSREGNP